MSHYAAIEETSDLAGYLFTSFSHGQMSVHLDGKLIAAFSPAIPVVADSLHLDSDGVTLRWGGTTQRIPACG